jgi:FKBP-type peptidyl-prolyl cis-trans isomerase (trigger factor)
VIENETIDKLLNELYPKALKKENIIPTGPANLKELISTRPFDIVIEVEVLPVVEIDEKKVKKIKLKKTAVKVEQDEVESTIQEIEKRFTKFEVVE